MKDIQPEDKTPMWHFVTLKTDLVTEEYPIDSYNEFVYYAGTNWDKYLIEDYMVVGIIRKEK